VTSPDADLLVLSLSRRGASTERTGPDRMIVTGQTREEVGRTAAGVGAVITGMRDLSDDLEAVFTTLIHQAQQGDVPAATQEALS
jgi:hypothetical protein